MARVKAKRRIEPRIGGTRNASSLDLRLRGEDRVAPAGRKRTSPARSHRRSGGPGKRRRTFLLRALYWSAVLCIWAGISLAGTVFYYAAQLPQMSSWSIPQRPPNARIVASGGQLLANRGGTGGETVALQDISPFLPRAVIAIEDQRFRQHSGIDPIGLARAAIANLMAGSFVQGGSTITQQLAKNLFLEPDRTIGRKIQEAVLALWLERKFSKDEILELYLNRVYFGSGAYGADAAARRYFDKPASELTLAELALLAGLLKAPSRLSPARDAEAARERAQIVLEAMREAGFISASEAADSLRLEAKMARRHWTGAEHYIADMVMQQLPVLIGELRSDVVVETSIDMDMQDNAARIIETMLARNGEKHRVSQAALVAIDPSGAIVALVGGRDYSKSQFNRAVDAMRQPGSAFKPIVYLAALEAGRSPESIREDAPVRIGKWRPENYDRQYRGPVTLEQALALSLNTVAAQLAMEVGPKAVIETARRLGIRSDLRQDASIALGTSEVSLLELTAAYAPFANGGYGITPWLIRSIRDENGKVLYRRDPPAPRKVVGWRELSMMNSMLAQVVASGTGRAADFPGIAKAGKTGTTQNARDALFIGYTSRLISGIWFGNDDGAAMRNVSGGGLPAIAWRQFMQAALSESGAEDLPGLANLAALPPLLPPEPIRNPRSEQPPRPSAGIGDAETGRRSLFDLLRFTQTPR